MKYESRLVYTDGFNTPWKAMVQDEPYARLLNKFEGAAIQGLTIDFGDYSREIRLVS